MSPSAKKYLTCFQTSAAPRPEKSHSDEKHALFGLDTRMAILNVSAFLN
jgi:hypothetical protein